MTDQPTHRSLGPDDLAAVVALLTASDLAVVGFRDFTDDEVATELAREGIEHRGWYAERGTLVGYAWVERVEDTEKVEIDVYVHPGHDSDLGRVIVDWLTDRARALADAAGHGHVSLDIGAYRQDERTRGWLSGAGFEVGTTFTRMRVDLDGPVDLSGIDPALRLRESGGNETEADRRVAHRIQRESFVDHYGHVDTSYDTFVRRLTERGEGWASVWLAELGGEPVGVLVATRQFEPDQDAGFVRTLGVLPAARGRGVATSLLRTYFDACRRAGRSAVLLHVDVANVTGALRLYESVGMRPVLEIDAWAMRTSVRG